MASGCRPRTDDVLRKYGFEVVARPAKGPAKWRRKRGVLVYDEAAALVVVERVRKVRAAAGVVT